MRSMVRYQKIACVTVLLSVCGVSEAKTRLLKWQTELCEVQGYYDDAKVTAEQLKNTQQLVSAQGGVSPIYDYKHTEDQDRAAYIPINEQLTRAENYVLNSAVQNLRKQAVEQNNFFYRLEQVKRQARMTHSYESLKLFDVKPMCLSMVKAMEASGEQKWQMAYPILVKSCQNNADPADCIARSETSWRHSEQAINDELLSYHWHNCANSSQPRASEQQIQAAERGFHSYLRKIRYKNCEEP